MVNCSLRRFSFTVRLAGAGHIVSPRAQLVIIRLWRCLLICLLNNAIMLLMGQVLNSSYPINMSGLGSTETRNENNDRKLFGPKARVFFSDASMATRLLNKNNNRFCLQPEVHTHTHTHTHYSSIATVTRLQTRSPIEVRRSVLNRRPVGLPALDSW